jgi:hypothetical protein
MMFWFENMFYLLVFILYELVLLPYLYVKVALTVGFVASLTRLVPMLLFWLCFGPCILLFQLCKDTFYFVKLLCDYMDDEDQHRE